MPTQTGLSHAVAAVVVLLVGPVLSRLIETLVTTRDVETVIEALAVVVSSHPIVTLDAGLTATALYVAAIAVLAFVWGYAYHIKRH